MKQQVILPKFNQLLGQMGENIKLKKNVENSLLFRFLKGQGIARSTLYLIEKGDASVSLGAYFNVLKSSGFAKRFSEISC